MNRRQKAAPSGSASSTTLGLWEIGKRRLSQKLIGDSETFLRLHQLKFD